MKLLFLIAAIFIGHITYGQKDTLKPMVFPCDIGKTLTISENEVLNIFKASIQQPAYDKISIPSNEWLTCNRDSSYSKMDTLYFCSNAYYKNKPNTTQCCELIAWTFYEEKAFILTEMHLCDEPAKASAVRERDYHKLEILKKNNKYFLQTFNNSKLIDTFEILTIKTFPKCNVDGTTDIMTLVRQH
ncbi:MAG: hypothetical protein ABJB11_18630 [Ferruginibacter sp.]